MERIWDGMEEREPSLASLSCRLAGLIESLSEPLLQEQQERYYLCPEGLTFELGLPLLPWQDGSVAQVALNSLTAEFHPRLLGQPQLVVPGSLAERLPAMVMSGQFAVLRCQTILGQASASWPEFCWGLLIQAYSAKTMERPTRSPGLALRRWQASWAPPGWLSQQPDGLTAGDDPWMMALMDLNPKNRQKAAGAKGRSLIFDDLVEIGHGLEMAATHDAAGAAISFEEAIAAKTTASRAEVRADIGSFAAPAGHQQWPGQANIELAWGPFPGAGAGSRLAVMKGRHIEEAVIIPA